MIRKILSALCVAAMALAAASCGVSPSESVSDTTSDSMATEATTTTETTTPTESTSEATSEATKPDAKSDTLVVVFSCTGTTKSVADKIVSITGADLYEIEAKEPYTDADRDWTDKNSRCTKEQNDKSARPEISSSKITLDGYKTIFIGYPIWFGQEPRILDTFVESYDFGTASVIPFCTSGSSGIGSSGKDLAKNAGSGSWLDGKRFGGGVTEDELKSWIGSLGLQKGESTMVLKISGTEVPVIWEDNASVKDLQKIAANGLKISMSMYGGFEQVGPIGQKITRSDNQTTTAPGDIVLYSGDQMVIFYGSNSWSYTRLGKIDLPEDKIEELLSNGDVTVTLEIK